MKTFWKVVTGILLISVVAFVSYRLGQSRPLNAGYYRFLEADMNQRIGYNLISYSGYSDDCHESFAFGFSSSEDGDAFSISTHEKNPIETCHFIGKIAFSESEAEYFPLSGDMYFFANGNAVFVSEELLLYRKDSQSVWHIAYAGPH